MKSTQIQPLFDNVLVQPLEHEEVSPGGIVLPESAKEKPQIGKVQGVGPGVLGKDGKLEKMHVKKGDKVLYKKWGGNEVKVGNEEWQILEQKDILAVIA
jgi:chaperonin GroES